MNFLINYLQRDFSVSRSVIAENWKNDAVATIKSDQSRNTSSQGKKELVVLTIKVSELKILKQLGH